MAANEIDTQTRAPGVGITRREELGATTLSRSAETSATSAAALSKAEVEARFMVAISRPRDMEDVRVRLLRECDRPGFAEVARYSLPRSGKRVEGPTIRFAEAAARLMGNLDIRQPVIFEDDERRIMRVTVTDLETNATYSLDVTITKTIERRTVKDGQEVIGVRQNSTGQMVHIVRSSDDELVQKQAAAMSKAIRNLVLRLTPGDIIEECMDRVVETQSRRDAADPDAAKKKLIDAFVGVGVKPAQLRDYVGHELDILGPAELVDLRGLFAAIRDGQITMAQALEEKNGSAVIDSATGEIMKTNRTASVKDALNKTRKATQKADSAVDYDPSTGEVPPGEEDA